MVLLETPICNFGEPAHPFGLPGTDGKLWTLDECRGENGTLVMFICNHCPYVKAIREKLVRDTAELAGLGVNSVAIMPNDPVGYPEDSMDNMRSMAAQFGFPFPYLMDPGLLRLQRRPGTAIPGPPRCGRRQGRCAGPAPRAVHGHAAGGGNRPGPGAAGAVDGMLDQVARLRIR